MIKPGVLSARSTSILSKLVHTHGIHTCGTDMWKIHAKLISMHMEVTVKIQNFAIKKGLTARQVVA